MKRQMKIEKIRPPFGTQIACGLFAFMLAACSSETLETEGGNTPGDPVRIASVTEILRGEMVKSDETLTPPNGTYSLGYKTEVANRVSGIVLNNGNISETGLYWAGIGKEENGNTAFFTLSNVNENEKGEMTFPEHNDILWGSCSQWMAPLDFHLSHRMAEVLVELELEVEPSTTIEQVSLVAIRQEFTFNRQTGEVVPQGSGSEKPLESVSQTEWSGTLPPQSRTNDMELKVVTSDGIVYKRTLPYSMIESTSTNQSQSIPLKFRAGYRLLLKAKVTYTIDYTIFFTGATLVDWEYKGSHSVVAKKAGIYTETELKDWIVKYNAYQKDKSVKNHKALLRYGTFDTSAQKWTFTLSRNITVTDKTNWKSIDSFSDILTRLNNYQLTNITRAELFTVEENGADILPDIFK